MKKNKPRILVIDDDETLRAFIRLVLTNAGDLYEVLDASDGRAALKMHQEKPFDLIITDIFMPEMEGVELIRILRNTPVKIIAISGGGMTGPELHLTVAEKLGAHRTFTKPFEPDELLTAMDELLNES